MAITPAREHEVRKAWALSLRKGSIVVEDLGYTDYAWYGQLTAQKIFFVTRQKRNARYQVLERRPVNASLGLVADENIRLTGVKARECPNPLRRIAYRDPATGKGYVFLTNHFRLAAKTIADIYKERWQIEIFFHWIKQNLKINSYASHWPNRTEMILIESDQLDNVGPEEKRRPRKLAHVTFGRSNWLVQLKELCEKRG